MPEESAFCVLVQLTHKYDLRGHFTPKMELLHVRMYQWERLLVDELPLLSSHLQVEGIMSTMYASQWFLTLFAYRFPIAMVYRIMDLLVFEGVNVLFQIGLALLKRSEMLILHMDFENLLDFLQNGIFDFYKSHTNTSELLKEAISWKISPTRITK